MTPNEMKQAEVAIDQIEIVSNCRRTMNPALLEELAANIKKVGVLEPVLLRREKDRLILIAGARRIAAATQAGLKKVPARVLNVDEGQAAEIQALENLHREDLSDLDEAQTFKTLLDLGHHTVETLAGRMDKSTTYIYRSLRLLDLPPAGLKALEEGKITSGHAHQILRAPAQYAEKLIAFATEWSDWDKRYPTVGELIGFIAKTVERDLAKALFPKNTAYAGMIACTSCPFNTGNQNMLFDGAEKGHCTNPGCFTAKQNGFYKELREKGEKKFDGLRFIGMGVQCSYEKPQIKGASVVSAADEKIRKALKAHPEKFGFGILRPDAWSKSKPQLVLLCKDPALTAVKPEPGYREPTPEERAQAAFVQEYVNRTIWEEIVARFTVNRASCMGLFNNIWDREWTRRELKPLVSAFGFIAPREGDADVMEYVPELDAAALTKLVILALATMARLEAEDILDDVQIDWAKIQKAATSEATKLWKAERSSSAKGETKQGANAAVSEASSPS